jgi:hypothetical protein
MKPKSHIHTFRIVGKCEGMNPHTPKWAPILRIEVMMDSQIFKKRFQELNLIGLKSFYTIGKLLKRKCLKWACMTHLNIYNTSYGRKKRQKSKCQFDSQPL